MSELLTDSPHAGLSLADISYALFKHKWKIVLGAVVGICAALVVYSTYKPVYESNAKLLVRYVLDRSTVDPEATSNAKMASSVIGSEVEILTSWDLAMEVVEAIGVKRLLPGADPSAKTDAASTITGGLRVMASGESNILFVAYTNPDPELATLVLSELVNRYFNKHLEVHRSAGAFDFVTQQTDQVRARLNETEDALKTLKAKAGIISLADSYAALSRNLATIDDQIHTAEDEISVQRARIKAMEEANAGEQADASKGEKTVTTSAQIETYKALVARLSGLRQIELDLLAKYTPENPLVKLHQKQIETLQKQRLEMEEKSPDLSIREGSAPPTLAGEKAKLAAMEAKLATLTSRLGNVRTRIKELADLGSQITDLERNQELQIASYKYFKNTLEKARIDEALDPSKMPNISAVQRPSPPHRVYGKRDKIARGLAGGGLGIVVALVLLRELILNRAVKRPLELETRLGIPLLLSIPQQANGNRRSYLPRWPKTGSGDDTNGQAQLAPWETDHFIRPYAVAIRDRLGLYFELNRMTHKPKLVGVTGFVDGTGTSTLAAGLAAALSELDEGKVLLVDVNLGPHEVHPFFHGRPAMSLNAALQVNGESNTPAADNLYLATVAQQTDGPAQLGLKKFFDMMPNLKASDFDYIIFDMPPLGQTSPTLGMAGFMDKLLLVVEAEKSNRDAVKRGFDSLVMQRDNVSVIFNKARSYSPKWLHGDS